MNYPDHWRFSTFDSISEEIDKSGPQPTENFDYIEISSIDRDVKKITDVENISAEDASSRAKYRLKSGDLLISKVRPKLNGVAIVPERYHGAIGTTGFYVVRSNSVNNKFLYYFCQTRDFIDSMDREATGSSYPSVNVANIEAYEVPVPPKREQERIVAKIEELFSKLDSGVSELQKGIKLLKQYRLSLLKAAFEGKLSNQARTRNGWEVTQDFEEHEDQPDILEIPSEWRWVEAGSVINSLRNGIYKPEEYYNDDGIASLRMYNIEDGRIVWKDIKRMDLTDEELEKFRLEPGDLLVNRVNSRELVGKAAVIPEALEESVFESKNIRVKLSEDLRGEYLGHWFYFFRKRYFMSQVKQTVGQATVTQTQIKEMPIPLAPIAEQDEILGTIERKESILSDIREQLDTNLTRAKRLRQSILKRAFEGNLVPQDPTEDLSSPDSGDTNVEKEGQVTLTEVTKNVE